jgi:hypothetical protein
MDWPDYKRMCESPNHFSRWALELTRGILREAPIARKIVSTMNGRPLEKPADHRGGPETDYFRVELDDAAVRRVIAAFAARIENSAGRERRRLAHLCKVWEEYLESIEGG